MINNFIKQVAEFHDAFNVKRGNVDVELRYKLFKEEFDEYEDAKDLVERTDAICDMLYIACGTLDVHNVNKFRFEYSLNKISNEFECLLNINILLDEYLDESDISMIENAILYTLDLAHHNNILDILPELFDEVHASNMSKLDENGKPIINDGVIDPTKPKNKILKGKNFFEPKLKEILIKHGKLNA